MEENSDGDRLNEIDVWDRQRLVNYSLYNIIQSHNMKILCQGREDNPVHIKKLSTYNVLIKNFWKKKIQYGVGPLLVVNVQLQ